jgi:2-octaprenyl-6-methoxyphenol hydroxylase
VICSLALEEALTQHKADRIEPLSVSQVRARTTRENPSVKLASGEMIHSDLVILADGGRSGLTESLGLTAQRRSFYRSAIMGRIRVDTPKAGRAYERFIGTGPLAILPIESSTYGFVWSLDPAYAEQLNQSPETLIGALQQAVPPEFGGIELGLDPVVIPLVERWVDQPYRPGVVLIGNGAQTIHPVAGQGLNLALRGLNLLVDALRTQDADEAVKTAFSQWRMNRDATRLASSGLEALFDRELLPRKLFTSLGMAFGDQSLWLKRKIAEAGMGVIS